MYYNTRADQAITSDCNASGEVPSQTTAEYGEIQENNIASMTSSLTSAVYDEVRNIGRPDVTSSEYQGLQNVGDNDYLQPYQTIIL